MEEITKEEAWNQFMGIYKDTLIKLEGIDWLNIAQKRFFLRIRLQLICIVNIKKYSTE